MGCPRAIENSSRGSAGQSFVSTPSRRDARMMPLDLAVFADLLEIYWRRPRVRRRSGSTLISRTRSSSFAWDASWRRRRRRCRGDGPPAHSLQVEQRRCRSDGLSRSQPIPSEMDGRLGPSRMRRGASRRARGRSTTPGRVAPRNARHAERSAAGPATRGPFRRDLRRRRATSAQAWPAASRTGGGLARPRCNGRGSAPCREERVRISSMSTAGRAAAWSGV